MKFQSLEKIKMVNELLASNHEEKIANKLLRFYQNSKKKIKLIGKNIIIENRNRAPTISFTVVDGISSKEVSAILL